MPGSREKLTSLEEAVAFRVLYFFLLWGTWAGIYELPTNRSLKRYGAMSITAAVSAIVCMREPYRGNNAITLS